MKDTRTYTPFDVFVIALTIVNIVISLIQIVMGVFAVHGTW